MLALIFTRKLRPMVIGSSSPVVDVGRDDGAAAGDLVAHELRRDEVGDGGAEALAVGSAALARASAAARPRFSRMATYSISSVMMPARAYSSWVTGWPAVAAERLRLVGELGREVLAETMPLSSGFTARPAYCSTSPRAATQASRRRGSPASMSIAAAGSV